MTPDDQWEADQEGNLTPPTTDEFGREDPASVERERRRMEREMRRRGAKPKKEKKGVTGGFGRIGRRKKPRKAPPPEAPPTEQQPVAPEATRERPVPRRRRAPAEEAAPERASLGERAAAGRDALRGRMSRGGGDEKPPRAPRDPGSYGRRRIAAIVLGLVGILLVWFLVAFFQPFAGDGKGEGTVTVDIPEGSSAGEIAKILDEAGVVSSARLFEWRLKLGGKSGDVQASTYTLASGMSYSAAIDRLTGESGGGLITVTIPEGLDRNQIAADILPEGVSSDEYLELTKAPPPGLDIAQYGAPKAASLEGFLFPATYDLQEGQGAEALRDMQLAAFQQNIGKVDLAYAKKKNLTVYDILIIASMIDKEVQVAEERPLVAAVIYNRLSQGIPLGIDATTRFETGNYTEQIPNSDLQADTPYNTRLNQGLTPTPIGNPGLEAIKAAAAPAKVNFIYFVVKPGTCGEHSFTASEKEFETLAAQYQQALEAEGGSPTSCPE